MESFISIHAVKQMKLYSGLHEDLKLNVLLYQASNYATDGSSLINAS